VNGQRELLEVVLALHACGRFADLLHGGQKEPDQDGNNRDHDEQLDQREPGFPTSIPHTSPRDVTGK
jgi:hypothetical protein